MTSSIEVVKDQNGYFRDTRGRPLVVIFNGKDKNPDEISWQEPIIGPQTLGPAGDTILQVSKKGKNDMKPLKFRNSSHPVKKAKRVVRTRVDQDPQQQKSKQKGLIGESHSTTSILVRKPPRYNDSTSRKSTPQVWIPRQPLSFSGSFTSFPIQMEPYMHTLVYRYISVIAYLPQDIHGAKFLTPQGWLPLAVTDAALFHCLLCGAALHRDVTIGKPESIARFKHLKEAVHLINTQLQDPGKQISDSTIVSVAHLADYGCMADNYAEWKIHINGLQRMVQLRGGFKALSQDLQSKIYRYSNFLIMPKFRFVNIPFRADIAGSIASLSKPRFTTITNAPYTPLDTDLPPLSPGFQHILKTTNDTLPTNLITILHQFQYLNSLLTQTPPSLTTIAGIITMLENRLLTLHAAGTASTKTPNNNQLLHDLCCIAGLLNLQTLSTSRAIFPIPPFPRAPLRKIC
ncbi:hypothetical protein G7Y89_g5703 [Cudoniella acicularis]|uniref:Uncharacterized protein n=1 Tax=Cudoniella acicularis TaxID=354080 RepID=A0A8H4RM11_9HELO|nr:hypothetical protein G7Y89_g5703 [Cudoniella acicularis]